MNVRDMRHTTSEEKQQALRSAPLTEAVDTLLTNKTRDTLQPGEAHIVIETEPTEDGIAMMMSCVASLSSTNKVSIVHTMMRKLDFSPMEVIMLLLQAKDMIEDEPFGGPSRSPFAQ